MEKRVLFSAFIVLLASFLAFNFGGGTPTGQFSTSTAIMDTGKLAKCGISPDDVNNFDVSADTLSDVSLAYSLSRSRLTNPLDARRVYDLLSRPAVGALDTNSNGRIDKVEYDCAAILYGNTVKETVRWSSGPGTGSIVGGYCSRHQEGDTYCNIFDRLVICQNGMRVEILPSRDGEVCKVGSSGAHYVRKSIDNWLG